MTEAYPLYWPEGWPRTEGREQSRFEPRGLAEEAQHIRWEIERLGGRDTVVSTNVPLRRDGLPYSDHRKNVGDPGVAVYFTLKGKPQCIPCDRWLTVEENCRAIWKSIEAMRGLERWGARSFVDAAFRGFEALPAPGVTNWRHILGSEITTLEQAEVRYRRLARERHPDSPTGSDAMMAELNVAIAKAREELR